MRLKALVIAAVCVVVAWTIVGAAPDVTLLPAKIRGVVLQPDGDTPVSRMPVRLWNADTDEVVYKTQTNKDGVFEVPELTEGNHYVTVGPVRIEMRVLTARAGTIPQAHSFVVVVPKRMPLMPILLPSITAAGALPEIMSL